MQTKVEININNSSEVALCILELVRSLENQYGKITLSKILKGSQSSELGRKLLDKSPYYGSLEGFSLEQIENIISQLTDIGYLKSLNIGFDFEMNIIELTEKGKSSIENKAQINFTLPRVYPPNFTKASDIPIIDSNVIEEYYKVKIELTKLQNREEELKEIIKGVMVSNNLPKIHTDKIDIFCKKIERINYPKQKIELYVPKDIIEKIKEKKEIIVLSSKIKILGSTL